ncbi:phage terminase large subunit [Streptomyces sp. NPDC060011]|uniref:phage terminase large subunit n=1 Tax=Streptomyces sp. NPDC060011 TaxID=3347037 RepID=UPI0036895CFF
MPAKGDVVRFEPRGAVLEAFRSKAPEILLSGAAGTGKTVGALTKIHLACLKTPKVRALVVRKTLVSLTASTLVTFKEKVAREAIAAGMMRFHGGSAQEPASFIYNNGSVIVVGGLDRASRLLSTEFDLVLVDEAIEVTDEDLDTIVSRLRNGVLSYQQLLMCTNPGPPAHHLKVRADSGRCQMLYSKHEDNPRLYDGKEWTEYGKTYRARLDSLTGVRYQRLRWGRWVAAEGQVYENWDPEIHVIDPFPIPADWTRWWSIDWGYTNPFVWQDWAEDFDGRLYLVREVVRTQRIVEDHAEEIKQITTTRRGDWSAPSAVIADHDAEDRATFEKHMGVATIPAKKGKTAGIQAFQSRLEKATDGKPRLVVFRNALRYRQKELVEAVKPIGLVDEITGYVWASKPGASSDLKEEPVKENDHSMDAARYMVAHRDMRGAPTIRWIGGPR